MSAERRGPCEVALYSERASLALSAFGREVYPIQRIHCDPPIPPPPGQTGWRFIRNSHSNSHRGRLQTGKPQPVGQADNRHRRQFATHSDIRERGHDKE
jgi:hypothetical protein